MQRFAAFVNSHQTQKAAPIGSHRPKRPFIVPCASSGLASCASRREKICVRPTRRDKWRFILEERLVKLESLANSKTK
jgi:hypothetical protein